MVSIGPTIRVQGENQFRSALRRVSSEVKTAKDEMDKLSNSFTKNTSALEKNKAQIEALNNVIAKQKTNINDVRTAYEKADQHLTTTIKNYELQRDKTDELTIAVAKAKNTTKEMTKAFGEESDEAKKAAEEQKKLEKALSSSETKQKNYYNEVFRGAEAVEGWKDRLVQAESELEKMKRELENMPNSFQIIGDELQKSGEKLSEWGDTLSKYVTAPIVALGAASVKNAATFEDGMAKIYTIATESQKPMAEMREELIQISNDTGYSLEDLAEAAYQSVSASVDAAKATQFMTDATKLARAGFTSTTQAVDLLTTVINAYGYSAEDAAYINDVLLKTQNDGKTIIDELAQSMGTVIPTAANYNVSLEQLAGAYATMTKQGVNTSRSTTFLNAMFTELEKESSAISKVLMNETGKSFAQLMGEGNSLADVLRILYDSVDRDNEQFQRLFGNIRSGKAAAALVRDDFSVLTNEIERMYNATGQTAYALEVLDTPALKAKKALNQLKNTTVDLGETFIQDMLPIFEDVVAGVRKFVDWFHELDDGTKVAIVRIAAFSATIGPLFKLLGGGITIFGKVVSGIGSLQKELLLTSQAFNATGLTGGAFLEGLATSLPTILGVTAAYVGLGFALGQVQQAHFSELQSMVALDDKMTSHINAVEDLKNSYGEARQSFNGTLEQIQANTVVTQKLVDQYNSLVDENGLISESNQVLANGIIENLATALGLEKDQVTALIEENGKFGESIQQNIRDIEARAKAAAYEDLLTQAIHDHIVAEKNLNDVSNDKVVVDARVKKLTTESEQAYRAYTYALQNNSAETERLRQKWQDTSMQLGYAKQEQDKLNKSVSTARNEVADLNRDIDYYGNQIVNGVKSDAKQATQGVTDGVNEAESAVAGGVKNIKGQLDGIDTYTSGYHFDLGFANGIADYVHLAKQSAAQVAYAAKHSLNGALSIESPSKETFESGEYFGEGFIEGIESFFGKVSDVAYDFGTVALAGLQSFEMPEISTVSNNKTVTMNAPITVNVPSGVTDPQGVSEAIALTLDRWLGERL